MSKKPAQVAIVGAGPAGLFAAERLAAAGLGVTVYDRMASPGRKFLLAGRGGLNLTHSEPREAFLARYGEARAWLQPVIDAFPPPALQAWAETLGEPTFVGSSGRVFPRSFKASPLLRAWLRRLDGLGVKLVTRHRLVGWGPNNALIFETADGRKTVRADAVILALGGASWPRMGSDGAWVDLLGAKDVPVAPLKPANMGVQIGWSPDFAARFAGQPLKGIAVAAGGPRTLGEAMITATGLEGSAIYAVSGRLRDGLATGRQTLTIDLRPSLSAEAIAGKLEGARAKDSLSTILRKRLAMAPQALGLLREGTGGPLPQSALGIARRIKAVALPVDSVSGIERAISSAGGVMAEAIADNGALKALPHVFVAGEMLDWEAPTGGYLLQASFATGEAAAQAVAASLKVRLADIAPSDW
ncbi:TIGR03862 family flavoprotein [Phreatobacter aquaticus]|uniref:TIGR03862 family flavoprotein n=1 Tax=Phreatobacter aquaticus TaxID=2570229 RepID=A0A4D7QJ22_9HYPH|nr:TIGR03862 family flavoprotein [Phreatobacter aquaticus]QCK85307.1 TIGR03862 family flavoprotein [Phreatobacter aquaticus]